LSSLHKTPRRTRQPRVGALIETSHQYGRRMLRGIATYAANADWIFHFEPWRTLDLPAVEGYADCDGIIALPLEPELAQVIARSGARVVCLSSPTEGLDAPLVQTDAEAIGRMGAEHLLDQGFRRLAFCADRSVEISQRRGAAFVETARHAGAEVNWSQPSEALRQDWHFPAYEQEVTQWLATLPRPIGIMAASDSAGRHVLEACRRLEIPVPQSVAVVGVDNDDLLCLLSNPPLSSIDHGTFEMGYRAAELLDQLLHGQPPPERTITVPPVELVVRQSTDVIAVEDPNVATALQFIRRNASRGITVREVLNEVAVSRRKLEQSFRKLLGRSIHEELTRIRIAQARELLLHSGLGMTAIAHRSGFAHPPHFSRVFRKATGQSPQQFRRSITALPARAERSSPASPR
jgi:LacI family transcriptional regulator